MKATVRRSEIDLETRLAIEEIPLLCIDAVCRNDADQYAECFKEEDSMWDASALAGANSAATGFPFRGREAIRNAFIGFQSALKFAVQTHLSTHISYFDGRTARVRYYLGEYGQVEDEKPEYGVGMYRDVYDLCDDGNWRIKAHVLTPVFYGAADFSEIRIITRPLPFE